MTFPPLIIWAKGPFFFEQLFSVVARTWLGGKLEKAQMSERAELIEEMWIQSAENDDVDEEEEYNNKEKDENMQAVPNHHDHSYSAPPPPSAPDCPICFESMTPPLR